MSPPSPHGPAWTDPAPGVPADPEAEKAVLGCLLSCDDAIRHLSDIGRDLFFEDSHGLIFDAIAELHGEGHPVGIVTVTGWLRDHRLLERAGGPAYVTHLHTAFECSPLVARHHVGTLRAKATKRELIRTGRELEAAAMNGSEPETLLAEYQERLVKLTATLDPERSGGIPAIIDLSEQLRQPPQKPPEVIHGILHQGSKLVLGGSSKSYKTWTLLGLGIAVASGSPWLGFNTEKGPVLYVNAEVQSAFFVGRVQAVCSAMELELTKGQMDVLHLRGHCADLAELRQKIVQRIDKKGYALIILDPIYKLMAGRDENKAGDIAAVLDEVEKLAVETKAAVAFGAHHSKGNQAAKEAIDRISGSGVFARDPDAILNLTRHEEENAFILEATLRNCPPAPSFVVRWDYPLMRRDDELDPTRLKQQPRGARTKKKPSLAEYVALFPEDWNLEPTEALRGGTELRELFREKGWDEKCEAALREQACREDRLGVATGPHNRHFIGSLKAIDAFRRARTEGEESKKPKGKAERMSDEK